MKAAVVEAPSSIAIWDISEPRIDEYEALVKMKVCGLCNSTDLKIFHGKFAAVTKYPLVLGHEGVGEVIEKGKKVKSFKIGDVVLEPWAKIRDEGLGSGYGAFTEYTVVRDRVALQEEGIEWPRVLARQQVVPKDIGPVDAAILITMKEALSGLLNFGFKEDMSLLVFGDGPVGAALVKFARLLGASEIAAVGHWDTRLERIKALGADRVINEKSQPLEAAFEGRRFDLVIDAVGSNSIVNNALTAVREGGKVGMYGVASVPEFTFPLSQWPNNVSLQKLFFPFRHEDVHDGVIDYVRSGAVRPQDFYSHVMAMDDIAEAIALVERRQAFKVVIEIS